MYAKALAAAAIVLFACLSLPSSGASAAGVSATSAVTGSPDANSNVVHVWYRGGHGHWRGPGVVIYPYPYYGYPYDGYYYDDYYRRPYVSPCYRRCRQEHGPRYCYNRCER